MWRVALILQHTHTKTTLEQVGGSHRWSRSYSKGAFRDNATWAGLPAVRAQQHPKFNPTELCPLRHIKSHYIITPLSLRTKLVSFRKYEWIQTSPALSEWLPSHETASPVKKFHFIEWVCQSFWCSWCLFLMFDAKQLNETHSFTPSWSEYEGIFDPLQILCYLTLTIYRNSKWCIMLFKLI